MTFDAEKINLNHNIYLTTAFVTNLRYTLLSEHPKQDNDLMCIRGKNQKTTF